VLSDGGQALLNEIGRELVSRDNAHIRVIGHTDNIPTGSTSRFPSNEALSLARATSALSYLSSVGVPAERLAASGVADAYPIASNDTEAGRLANRRVEIVLTPAQ
jgi:flagellar motor protein MotB